MARVDRTTMLWMPFAWWPLRTMALPASYSKPTALGSRIILVGRCQATSSAPSGMSGPTPCAVSLIRPCQRFEVFAVMVFCSAARRVGLLSPRVRGQQAGGNQHVGLEPGGKSGAIRSKNGMPPELHLSNQQQREPQQVVP